MKKIISLLLIVGIVFTAMSSVVAVPMETTPMTPQNMACTVGGDVDCDDVLMGCLSE